MGSQGLTGKILKLLKNMCEAIKHRGPDGEGTCVDDGI